MPEPTYDLFVIHATADEAVVRGALRSRLRGRVLLSSELRPGLPLTTAIAQAVAASRTTLAILTPAYLADRWADFGAQLAGHRAGVGAGLVPVLLETCDVPIELDFRVALDLRDPADWDAQLARIGGAAPDSLALVCPYPGLAAFGADREDQFFGRGDELRDLLDDVTNGRREIFLVGPSGSGKSSLLGAGLIPRLARGDGVPAPYRVCRLRPGPTPTAALAAAGAALAPADTRVAIVIDQLEEIFTQADDAARAAFIAALRPLRADPRCVLVYALRDDFYSHLIESQLGVDVGKRPAQLNLLPLHGDGLRAAITGPLAHVGVTDRTDTVRCYIDPRLVDALVEDAAGEPSPLPLVQKALERVWHARRDRLLPFDAYDALRRPGEPGKARLVAAFSRWADARIDALRDDGPIARRILVRLVTIGADGRVARRSRTVGELRVFDRDRARFERVLETLIADRLVVARGADEAAASLDDHRVIELAHESLIAAWPTFAGWIKDDAEAATHSQRFEARAAAWVKRGRTFGGLFDEVECKEAEAWIATPAAAAFGISDDLHRFVAKSRGAKQLARAGRDALILAACLVAIGVVVFILAIRVKNADLRKQTAVAQGQAKAAEADRWIELDPGRAARLLHEAMALSDTATTRRIVDRWLRRRTLAALPTHSGLVTDAAWLDDHTIVSTLGDYSAAIWKEVDGRWDVESVVAIGMRVDGIDANLRSQRFMVRTGKALELFDRALHRRTIDERAAVGAVFTPDGDHLVFAWPGAVRVLDLRADPMAATTLRVATLRAPRVASDGESIVITGGGLAALRFDGSAISLPTLPEPVLGWRLVPLARGYLISDRMHGLQRLTRTATGLEASVLTASPTDTFAVHAQTVAALFRGSLSWLSTETGDAAAPPTTLPGSCRSLSWCPDGTRVAVACWDGLVRIVSVEPPSGAVRGAALPDDGRARDPATLDRALTSERKPTDRRIYAVALAPPAGTPGATGGDILRLYGPRDRVLASHSFAGHSDEYVVWAPDGTWLALIERDQIEILDGTTLEPMFDPIAVMGAWPEAVTNRTLAYKDYTHHYTLRVRTSADLRAELDRYLGWLDRAEAAVPKQP